MTASGRFLPLCLIPVLLAGCAPGPYATDIPLGQEQHGSARLPFRYRVPEGWFDTAAGDDSSGTLLWLVRRDYAATMAVRELFLDREALRQIGGGGERTLGEISFGLSARNPSTVILTPLEEVHAVEGEGYAYEQADAGSGDTTRVVVFRMGERAFEVQALLIGGRGGAQRESVFSTQQRFLEAFRP